MGKVNEWQAMIFIVNSKPPPHFWRIHSTSALQTRSFLFRKREMKEWKHAQCVQYDVFVIKKFEWFTHNSSRLGQWSLLKVILDSRLKHLFQCIIYKKIVRLFCWRICLMIIVEALKVKKLLSQFNTCASYDELTYSWLWGPTCFVKSIFSSSNVHTE